MTPFLIAILAPSLKPADHPVSPDGARIAVTVFTHTKTVIRMQP